MRDIFEEIAGAGEGRPSRPRRRERGEPDDGLRRIFGEELPTIHWQAIEIGLLGAGVPDHNGCADGTEFWIEYKATDGWAVGLEPEQVGWITERMIAGGRVFVITRRRHEGGPRRGLPVDDLYIHEGWDARALKADGLLAAPPVLHLEAQQSGPRRWDWGRVREVLVSWKMSRR